MIWVIQLSEQKRYYILSLIAYAQLFNKVNDCFKYKNKVTLGQMAQLFSNSNIVAEGGVGAFDIKKAFAEIKADNKLSRLIFTNYDNQNASGNYDGFVAYSFKDYMNNAYFCFRGSECDTPEGQHDGFLGADWLDNYTMGIEGKSKQFKDVKRFVKQNSYNSKNIFVTGHSKGGANGLFACSNFPNASGIVFNAPGIDEAIEEKERERLKKANVINYVAAEDKIGAVMFHSEKRVFCKMNETYNVAFGNKIVKVTNYNKAEGMNEFFDMFISHALQSFYWDSNYNLVLHNRSKSSMIAEALTQSVFEWNVKNGKPLDQDLEWIIKNKKNLGNKIEAMAIDEFLKEIIMGLALGEEAVLIDFIINCYKTDKDIGEILIVAFKKYMKLANVHNRFIDSIMEKANKGNANEDLA